MREDLHNLLVRNRGDDVPDAKLIHVLGNFVIGVPHIRGAQQNVLVAFLFRASVGVKRGHRHFHTKPLVAIGVSDDFDEVGFGQLGDFKRPNAFVFTNLSHSCLSLCVGVGVEYELFELLHFGTFAVQ